ncbi:unnamed protein product, partial [Merluccius merluccius]
MRSSLLRPEERRNAEQIPAVVMFTNGNTQRNLCYGVRGDKMAPAAAAGTPGAAPPAALRSYSILPCFIFVE